MQELDNLFNEPYGIDDSMEILRLLYNPAFDFKKSLRFPEKKEKTEQKEIEKEWEFIKKLREQINAEGIFNIHLSVNELYKGHYKIHSEKAFDVLYSLSLSDSGKLKRKYLETKVVDFFRSYEWETWAWKYAESLEESKGSSSYNAHQVNSQASDSIRELRLPK